jgi:hypothetical protein
MAVVVFDLDMTIIDSSHRHASNPDGSIDLAHWFQNATPERIAADTLLPLAEAVRRIYDAGHKVVLCTARCMQKADWGFIALHFDSIPHHALFSREGHFVTPDHPNWGESYHGFVGDVRGDGEIKLAQIQSYIESLGFKTFEEANVIIFEDNLKTLKMFQERGAFGMNAIRANEKIRKLRAA